MAASVLRALGRPGGCAVDRRRAAGSVAILAIVCILVSCTSTAPTRRITSASHSPAISSASSASTSSPSQLGAAGCRPASPISGAEVQGTGEGATLYGMIEAAQPLKVGAPIKIVWRMTGEGTLHLSAIGPNGKRVPLDWGPEPHQASNYIRPGQEWGAGYRFGAAGCWHLHAARARGSADVWLMIDP